MEIVNPSGEPAKLPEPEKPAPQMKCAFNEKGWMVLEANLLEISHDPEKLYMLRGYLDSMRDTAINLIRTMQEQRNQASKILKADQTKNGHRNFIRKLFTK